MNRSLAVVPLLATLVTSPACVIDAEGTQAEGSFRRELAVAGPVQLDVETGAGDIEVWTSEAGPVIIEGRVTARWNPWDGEDGRDRVREVEQSPPIEQEGNEIHIGRRRWDNTRISYRLTVPRDTGLRMRTGSGDVSAASVDRPLSAQTGSGDIRLGRVGGDLTARTGSGDVEVAQVVGGVAIRTGSGDVRLKVSGDGRAEVVTGSGDVDVDGASGALQVRTGSGTIVVSGSPMADWDLVAGSGDISVRTPESAAFTVNARSASGDIDARAVTVTERIRRRELKGTVRGGGPLVSLSTGSGEVRVR